MKITEANFQRTVIELAQLGRWRIHHQRPARTKRGWRTAIQGHAGFPDLVLVRPPDCLFVELKSDTGKPSPDQIAWARVIERCGLHILVWRPRDMERVKRILLGRMAVDEFLGKGVRRTGDVTEREKLKLCVGCRSDFYNDKNPLGVKRCWNLKKAKLVTRWKLGWWTTPATPGAFEEVKTLDCHHEPGRFAFYEFLPSFAKDPRRTGT